MGAATKARVKARFDHVQAFEGQHKKHRQEISKRFKLLERDDAQLAAEKSKLENAKSEQLGKVEALEKQVKEAERDKIRLRLDIKRAEDLRKEQMKLKESSEDKGIVEP